MCVCVQVRRPSFCLNPFTQALSLSLEPGYQPERSSDLPVSACHGTGIAGLSAAVPGFYPGGGDLNSGPHVYTARALNHRAISRVPAYL